MTANVQLVGYGLAAIAFLVLALLLFAGNRRRPLGRVLVAAAALSAVWAAGLAYDAAYGGISVSSVIVLEFAFDGIWLLFLAALLHDAVGGTGMRVLRYGGVAVAAALLASGFVVEVFADLGSAVAGGVLVFGSLTTSLLGLVGIEQIYRNARSRERRGLKYLAVALGGIFAYDLFMYSSAVVLGAISDAVWGARGFVVASCVGLIAIAARRAASWSVGIFVSRQIVFYGATLIAVGSYLVLVGFMGYLIRRAGGDWGLAAQVVFSSVAFLLLSVLLFSDRLRGRLRVFISKHFFENKYDYRQEWLRLIDTLTSPGDELSLQKRGLKALAQIVGSQSGLLWMVSADGTNYRCATSWSAPPPRQAIAADSSLPRFLEKTGWVVERLEYRRAPDHYPGLNLDDPAIESQEFEFVVPLLHDGALLGFATLSEAQPPVSLNFEDHDLLKTAGKQIASYLAQEIATEQLAESRQFEAFNKLTAYIMHDFKNLIAQQSMVVENAQRHKNNPEFIDDAIETIRGGVVRMRRIIDHLRQRSVERPVQRIELGKLVMQAVSQCADREPIPRAVVNDGQVWVRGDRERLFMAFYHAIRNAQDATPADGTVSVELEESGAECVVHVIDTGRGMDDEFIHKRLFKPFDSTKGTAGMGIGAYQIRETLRMSGGRVEIDSAPGTGTRLTMTLAIEPAAGDEAAVGAPNHSDSAAS